MIQSNRNEEKGFYESNEYKYNNYFTVSENTGIELLYITFISIVTLFSVTEETQVSRR